LRLFSYYKNNDDFDVDADAQAFKKTFEDSQKLMSTKLTGSQKETEEVGELLENLKVDDTKKEAEQKEDKVAETTKPSKVDEEEK
jgi:hypothetical protein